MPVSSHASRLRAHRALLLCAALALAGCASAEDRAQSHYQHGLELVQQKDYVKASLEFRNAVKLKKDLIPAWRELSQIEERNQNWEATAGILRTIVQLDPADLEARLRLGRLMLLGNALDDALKLVDAAGDVVNQNAGALAFRSAVALKLNDTAVTLFTEEFMLHLPGGPYHYPVPAVMAFLSGCGEITFSVLLVLGLATRFASLGLLFMTLIIELTIPDGWPIHITWAALALGIMAWGTGRGSIDYLVNRLFVLPTRCGNRTSL